MSGESLSGRILENRYEVGEQIGRGGMGEVYAGRHLLMARKIAIKVLSADRAGDPLSARRFVREARSAFRLDHPNCVRVTDFGATPDGILYIVMEYIDGCTASQELELDGPMVAARVAHIGAQVSDALAHAHDLGFAHRDLKPDNIMLVRRGADPDFVKVLDFGVAKIFDETGAGSTALSLSPLTQKGLVFGTPEYMSPEQAMGHEVGPVSDIYSLGAVMYELLTATVPFQGSSSMDVLTRHVKEMPMPPSIRRPDLDIPASLNELVLACLAKEESARPASGRELSGLLAEIAGAESERLSRVPRNVAASETMDLSSDAAAAARAAHAEAPPRFPLPPPARSRRRLWIAAALLVLAGAGAIALAVRGGDGDGGTPGPAATKTADSGSGGTRAEIPVDGSTNKKLARDGKDASPSPGADAALGAVAAVDAGAPDATETTPSARSTAPTSPKKRAVERHIRAAEAARRAGNPLKQLAEAHEALRLDPKNRRAALLVGDALVQSGDKVRGCKYLRRSRRRFRLAGCAD